jgi:DNA-binding transcriptional ArsR family regulator
VTAKQRILELLAEGELSAGELGAVVQREFSISQPGVSQHLRVLREHGFTTVRADGNRRLYAMNATPLREVDEWLERYRRLWPQPLGALASEPGYGSATSASR